MGNWDTTPTLISKKHSPDEASLTLILFLIANLNTRLILEGGSWSAPIVILNQAAALRASSLGHAQGQRRSEHRIARGRQLCGGALRVTALR